MKVKIFNGFSDVEMLERFINDFIVDVEVADIKFSSAKGWNSRNTEIKYSAMVIYNE